MSGGGGGGGEWDDHLLRHKIVKWACFKAYINTEICKLFAWFCCNKLLLNTGKTKCVLFRSRRRKIPNNVNPLVVGGQQINRSQHAQFLGVTVDEYLSWKEHLDYVCTKVSRSVGVISKLRYFLPQYTLVTLYNAIVMPHLMYCNIAWGHTFRTHVHKLQVLQKKVVRYITNSDYRSPSTPLFLQLHILPFDEMVSLNCLIFMFKCRSLQYTFLTDACVCGKFFHPPLSYSSEKPYPSAIRKNTNCFKII